MSRARNPYDNARCESFIKTLKAEEIYTRQYRDRADLERHMAEFLEQYYNHRRLDPALGYCSPASFEQSLRSVADGQMSFFRHEENLSFRCGLKPGGGVTSSQSHRRDEFPAEYSLASCSPAEPASAFSATYHAATNNPRSSTQWQRTAHWDFYHCLT